MQRILLFVKKVISTSNSHEKKYLKSVFVFLMLSIAGFRVCAQVSASAQWTFTTSAAANISGNITGGVPTFGSTLNDTVKNDATYGFEASGWRKSTAVPGPDTVTKYFQFSVAPSGFNTLSITSLTLAYYTNNSQVDNISIFYSNSPTFTNSTNLVSGGYFVTNGTAGAGAYMNTAVTATANQGQTLYFRIYYYGPGAKTALFGVTSLSLSGATSIPVCSVATNTLALTSSATVNWSKAAWSLGHSPYPCENVVITFTPAYGAGTRNASVKLDKAVTVNDLTIKGIYSTSTTGVKTLNVDGGSFPLTINGNLDISATGGNTGISNKAVLESGSSITINGDATIGDSTDNKFAHLGSDGNPDSIYINGDLIFNRGGAGNNSANAHFIFDGTSDQTIKYNNSANYADFGSAEFGNINTPVVTITGTSAKGGRINSGNLIINSGATLTIGAGATLNQEINGAGSLIIHSGAALQLSGTTGGQTGSNFPLNFGTVVPDISSTVMYNGSAQQTIYNGVTYGNLTINGSALAKAGGPLTISGNLFINSGATFGASTFTHSIAGNFTNNGTVNPGTSIIVFNGTSPQTLAGVTTFNSLKVNNVNGITLADNETINDTLTLSSVGLITTGTNTLTMGTTGWITGASSTGFINGNLSWIFNKPASQVFPVGNGAGNYHPITFNYTSLTGSSTVTVADVESSLTGNIPSTTKLYAAHYWNISQTGATTYAYKVSLDPTGFAPVGPAVILKSNGTSVTQIAATTPNYTSVKSFTTLGSVASPTGFALGQTGIPLTITANNINKCVQQKYSFIGTEFTSTGLVNGDTVTFVKLTSTGAPAASSSGNYSIIPSNATGSNLNAYAITYINGTMTVNDLPVPTFTVSPSASACSGNGIVYTTQAGQQNYVWTVSGTLNTDYTIVSGGLSVTDNSVTIQWLTSGSKVVTVNYSNAGGCSGSAAASASTNIILSPSPTFTVFAGTNSCFNSNVTYTTQSAEQNYAWSVAGTLNTDYTIISGGISGTDSTVTLQWLTIGNKTVTVNYSNGSGCNASPASSSTYVNALPSNPLVLNLTQVNPDCYGNPGYFSASVTGGASPYTYKLNTGLLFDPSGTYVSDSLFKPVVAGSYAYAAKDANGCIVTAQRLVVNRLTKTSIIGNTIVCYGGKTTINTIPVGGATPYTYSLDGGAFVPSSQRYFYVAAGTHTITVLDNVGCSYITDPITITQPSSPLTFTMNNGGAACTNNFAINLTASGSNGGYTYSNNGGATYQSSPVFSGLGYGSYSVIVKDQAGCSTTPVSVKMSALTASAIQGNTQVCTGASTTITTVPSGGVAPYTYSLDGAAFVSSAYRYFSVKAGVHTITVKDSAACTYSPASITINSISCPSPGNGIAGKPVTLQYGIDESAAFKVQAYPNPSTSEFSLKIQSSDKEDVDVIVTNITGVKVYEVKGSVDQLYRFGESLPGGMYIVQVKQGNTLHTTKIIKTN